MLGYKLTLKKLQSLKKLSFGHFLIVFCVGVILLQFLQVFYFQRDVFLSNYDASYWKDRVEHSRYILPLSDRGIGDDQFYAYGGYKIIEGEDPTKLVYDKPALGISIIGLFAFFLKNPSLSGLFFGLGSIILFYFVVLKTTQSKQAALVSAAFLMVDPQFTHNLAVSLLDLPQLFFLFASILLLMISNKNKRLYLLSVFAAGLALGIFAQLKIPVMYPVIFLLLIGWLYKTHGWKYSLAFLLGNGVSIVVGYIPYLVHGYSLIEFFRIQKFIVAFYKDSNLPLHVEAIWQLLFTGSFPGITDRVSARVAEWSFVYPLAAAVGIFFAGRTLFVKNEQFLVKIFAVILLASLIIFTFIPSYPRYILLFMPFLYFFLVKALFFEKIKKFTPMVIVLFLGYALLNTFFYFHQSPSHGLQYFYSNFSRQYFQDIYQEQVYSDTKKAYTRDEFKRIAMTALEDAKIRNIVIKEEPYIYSPFAQTVEVPITITYKTEYLGAFTERKNITLIRENSKWKVQWQWGYLLTSYEPELKLESTRIVGSRGAIYDVDGNILVEDKVGYLISINPTLLEGDKEKQMLELLSKLSTAMPLDLQDAYLENPLPDTYIPLFTTSAELTESDANKLESFKALKLETSPTRIYNGLTAISTTNTFYDECCTRIYSSYNFHGNKEAPSPELYSDSILSGYDGGSLKILNKDNQTLRTIIEKQPKDGEDITLSE